MRGFRETINSAFTTVRSVEGAWIDDDTELSAVAGGADPRDLVGASMVVTYVHDGGPLTLPGVAVGEHAVEEAALVYEPSGKHVIVEVADVCAPTRTAGSPTAGTGSAWRTSSGSSTRIASPETAEGPASVHSMHCRPCAE